jgi:hypothetical protein
MSEKKGGILREIKESATYRTMEVLTDPVRSAIDLGLHSASKGKYKPELGLFFGPIETPEVYELRVKDIPQFLSRTDRKLRGYYIRDEERFELEGSGAPQEFIGEDFNKWQNVKPALEKDLGVTISDYILFGRFGDTHVLFAETESTLTPLFLNGDTITSGFEYKLAPTPDNRDIELAISRVQADFFRTSHSDFTLRRMSSISNDHHLNRNSVFDRDGEMIESLRGLGGWCIGEIQTAARLLATYGINIEKGEVAADKDLMEVVAQAREMSIGEGSEKERRAKAEAEISDFLNQTAYYTMTKQYLKENPEIVWRFIESNTFVALKEDFEDIHLNSKGQTCFQVGLEMLANYFLLKFEGDTGELTHSQQHLKNKELFTASVENFITENSEVGNIPLGIFGISASINENPFNQRVMSKSAKSKAVAEAKDSLQKLDYQFKRHGKVRKLIDWVQKRTPIRLIDNEKRNLKVFTLLIGNMALVRADGKYLVSSYDPQGVYWPKGEELKSFNPGEAVSDTLEGSIRYIFNSELSENMSGYESQVGRIHSEGANLLKFLISDSRVPQNVREFIGGLLGDGFAVRTLERCGNISDQNPQVANRFSQEGFESFQLTAAHRYVHDFVRGVETNLIFLTEKNLFKRIARRMGDAWHDFDFSDVPDDVLNEAILKTLRDAELRIKNLNHQTEKNPTFKDKQEFWEKVFGWNTYEMWFLRWEKRWDVWNSTEIHADCKCKKRNSIFNQTFRLF